jgi:hypothetical protein
MYFFNPQKNNLFLFYTVNIIFGAPHITFFWVLPALKTQHHLIITENDIHCIDLYHTFVKNFQQQDRKN